MPNTTFTPWLKLEGAALLLAALWLYHQAQFSWLIFALTILLPDLGMVGYLRNPRVGAITYNAFHTTVIPFALTLAYMLGAPSVVWQIALILFAHIGMDRSLGFGLKSPEGFKHTHLS